MIKSSEKIKERNNKQQREKRLMVKLRDEEGRLAKKTTKQLK